MTNNSKNKDWHVSSLKYIIPRSFQKGRNNVLLTSFRPVTSTQETLKTWELWSSFYLWVFILVPLHIPSSQPVVAASSLESDALTLVYSSKGEKKKKEAQCRSWQWGSDWLRPMPLASAVSCPQLQQSWRLWKPTHSFAALSFHQTFIKGSVITFLYVGFLQSLRVFNLIPVGFHHCVRPLF